MEGRQDYARVRSLGPAEDGASWPASPSPPAAPLSSPRKVSPIGAAAVPTWTLATTLPGIAVPFSAGPPLPSGRGSSIAPRQTARRGAHLPVVIDPFSSFFPGKSESDVNSVLAYLASLRGPLGRAWLVHPARSPPPQGPVSRRPGGPGSGLLSSFADIIIEMRLLRRPSPLDCRRRLRAYSRYDETPRNRVIELSADATDYLFQVGPLDEQAFGANWQILKAVLEQATYRLTRLEIGMRRPASPPPNPVTLFRMRYPAVADRLVLRDGDGVRGIPFRYWLPNTGQRGLLLHSTRN